MSIEPLEGRALFSGPAAVPLAPGTAGGPAAPLTTLTPALTWSPVAGVNGYQVRVFDRTDGLYVVTVTVGPTATQYTPGPGTLLPGRAYTWAVRDVIGVTPASTRRRLAFTTPVPPAPVVQQPTGTGSLARPVLATVRPTVAWSAVDNASGYVVRAANRRTGAVVTQTVSGSATHYTFAAGELTPGGQYDLNVRDVIGTATALAVSNTVHFQLPVLPRPVTLGPGNPTPPAAVLPSFTPTFTWAPVVAVGGYSGYLLTIYDRTSGQATPVVVAATATSYTLPTGQLVAGHRYVWNLRLVDGSYTSPVVSPDRFFVAASLG